MNAQAQFAWTQAAAELESKSPPSLVNLTTFQHSFWSFVQRVIINYKTACSCPDCGGLEDAAILIIDATALGCQRSRAQPPPLRRVCEGPERQGTLHVHRVFINNRETRDALQHFCQSSSSRKSTLSASVSLVIVFCSASSG